MASTYLSLHYHLVFATKNRAAVIAPVWRSRLHEYLGGIISGLGGFSRLKLTGAAILVSCGVKFLQAAPAAYPYRSALFATDYRDECIRGLDANAARRPHRDV